MAKAFFSFVENHFVAYIACCCGLGLAIRLWMAHGSIGLFLDPLFPLFTR
jgi:hypothetical protein